VVQGRSGGHRPHTPKQVPITPGREAHGRRPEMQHKDSGLQNRQDRIPAAPRRAVGVPPIPPLPLWAVERRGSLIRPRAPVPPIKEAAECQRRV
jgi:hypothetical protein